MYRAPLARSLVAIFATISLFNISFAPFTANALVGTDAALRTQALQAAMNNAIVSQGGEISPFGGTIMELADHIAGSQAADFQCVQGDYTCPFPQVNPKGVQCMRDFACWQVTNGTTITGLCEVFHKCLGTGFTSPGGVWESISNFASEHPFLSAIGLGAGMSLLTSLMSPSGSSNNNNSGSGNYNYGGCTTQYYYTSDPNQLSNPCAMYNPSAASTNPAGTTPTTDSGISDLLKSLQNQNPNINVNIPSSTQPSIYDFLNRSASSSCPVYQAAPICAQGYVAQMNGFDSNGCQLPSTCVQALSSVLNSSTSSTPLIATIESPISTAATGSLATTFSNNSNSGQQFTNLTGAATDTGNSTNQNTSGGTSPDYSTSTEVPLSQALSNGQYYNNVTNVTTPAPAQTPLNQNPIPVPANGLHGDIRSFGSGVTIFASSRNGQTEVAGFYGSGGAAAGLCMSRPWASNFLSYVIPPAFFDNLCAWAGYPTGAPAQGGGAGGAGAASQNISVGAPAGGAVTNAPSPLAPQVKIWARPASVSLGGRTTVFWTSQNVSACTESSSDGNFSGSSTSGGASTVALSGPVTFKIACRALDGSAISGQTTVTIGI